MAIKLVVRSSRAAVGPDGTLLSPSQRFEYSYTFDQEKVVIGRGESTDVRLPHRAVSETHAIVALAADAYTVVDVGSTNGTRVNGTALVPDRKRALRSGDVIQIVDFDIEFRAGIAMESANAAERTSSLARRMVREVIDTLGPPAEPPRFVVENGPQSGTTLELREAPAEITIGRGEEATFPLRDADASRRHVAVRREWEGVFVRDLGSKNGLLVNGVRVPAEARLKDRDELLVGSTRLRFEDPADAYVRDVAHGPDAVAKPAPAAVQTGGGGAPGQSNSPPPQPESTPRATTPEPPVRGQAMPRRRVRWEIVVVGVGLLVLVASIAVLLIFFGH